MALNRAADALCEGEAGMSCLGTARLLRLYSDEMAEVAHLIAARSVAVWSRQPPRRDADDPPLMQSGES